jgi:uncharacterized protein YlxW (UPF0749 family)
LYHWIAAELKSSVSFDAARRAVSEAKAHAKAKAAALLQASSASWAERLHAAKADRAALQAQLEQLQQAHQQLQQAHQQLQQQVRHACVHAAAFYERANLRCYRAAVRTRSTTCHVSGYASGSTGVTRNWV